MVKMQETVAVVEGDENIEGWQRKKFFALWNLNFMMLSIKKVRSTIKKIHPKKSASEIAVRKPTKSSKTKKFIRFR